MIVNFSLEFLFSPVGRIEERRNIQWSLGQLRHMDEYKFARSHLHIEGMPNDWMTTEPHLHSAHLMLAISLSTGWR